MSSKAKLFILSMKSSPRLIILKKRLKKLGIKNFKVFYGTNINIKDRKKIIYPHYNKKIAEDYIGRPMTINEIDCELTAMKVYKYIIKKKIKNAIVMHDDVCPSKFFKKWIDRKFFLNGLKIIGFFCAPPGFLEKKKVSVKIFNDIEISLHLAKTHVFVGWCIQINYDFCKYYISITKGMVRGLNDFAFDFKKAGIRVFQTIPYLVYPDDKGISYLRNERSNIEKPLLPNSIKKNIIIKKILIVFRTIWYTTFIGYYFKKCSFNYYKEYYFDKYKIYLINFFLKIYINVNKIYNHEDNYPKEFKKFVKFIKV
jgi:GR25 family glycosyltransferase involved in LPS biosynthesis